MAAANTAYDKLLIIIRKVIDNRSHLDHWAFVIHCICNNINTKAVEAAAAAGAETAACVQRVCGTRFQCGQCRTDIDSHLKSWRQSRPLLDAAE